MNQAILVGNPNTGKTTLFNSLTNSNEHTGNWHGVTVESKRKSTKLGNEEYMFVDLPGVYSLTPLSFEERVTSEYLYNHLGTLVINIVDINNIYRNLYLTLELIRLGVPLILVINKTSGLSNFNNKHEKKLQEILNVPTIIIDAKNKKDVNKLKSEIIKFSKKWPKNIQNFDYLSKKDDFLINKGKEEVYKIIKDKIIYTHLNSNYACLKCLEKDELILTKLQLTKSELDDLTNITKEVKQEDIAKNNYNQIDNIFKTLNVNNNKKVYGKSKLDKLVLNKWLCIPIFLLVLLAVFYFTFFSFGSFLSSLMSSFVENVFGSWLLSLVKSVTSNVIIHDFFSSAIIGGMGAILSFLPQVVILYVCLGILEDSGYLSRVAFSLDDIFSRVGLSGKSIYTLLMGFGCSTTACLTARTMECKNSKIKTAMLSPYMSCSAKLPIYAVIGSAFFGANNVFVIFSMYLLGVIIALTLSVFYENTFLKSDDQSFILEFPPYRMPNFKRLVFLAINNMKMFLIRVGSLLVSVNIIVWVLSKFSFNFGFIEISGGEPIIATLGKIIAPIFIPLGFGNWGAVAALISGLIAKEIIVSTIGMINGIPMGEVELNSKISRSLTMASSVICFSPASAISYMVFCLLYSPCFATMGVLKREIGKKWTIISVIVQFAIAYLVSLFLYNAINIVMNNNFILLFVVLIFTAIILYSVFYCFNKTIKKHRCSGCGGCKH